MQRHTRRRCPNTVRPQATHLYQGSPIATSHFAMTAHSLGSIGTAQPADVILIYMVRCWWGTTIEPAHPPPRGAPAAYSGGAKNSSAMPSGSRKLSPDPYGASTIPPCSIPRLSSRSTHFSSSPRSAQPKPTWSSPARNSVKLPSSIAPVVLMDAEQGAVLECPHQVAGNRYPCVRRGRVRRRSTAGTTGR